MSHKASSWLAGIPAGELSGSDFRVLFHLCDAHNAHRDAESACFPSQERLREATGLSNGGLNNALNRLEDAGFIKRVRRTVPGAATQRTYYILGFDIPSPQEQTPQNGVCANSTFGEANSTFRGSKLHIGGVSYEPVSNQEEEPARARGEAQTADVEGRRRPARTSTSVPAAAPKIAENREARCRSGAHDPDPGLRALADWINSGRYVPTSMVTNTKRDALIASGLVTEDRLRQLQIY